MPVLHYHLQTHRYSQGQLDDLMLRSSEMYAQHLRCPIDRVRVFVHEYSPNRVCIAGQLGHDGAEDAPFFTAIVLEGRSLEDRHNLLTGFTDLLVEILDVDRSRVRGETLRIDPEDWAIAGVPASVQRKSEIDERARLASD